MITPPINNDAANNSNDAPNNNQDPCPPMHKPEPSSMPYPSHDVNGNNNGFFNPSQNINGQQTNLEPNHVNNNSPKP